jgi:hypothetical protein
VPTSRLDRPNDAHIEWCAHRTTFIRGSTLITGCTPARATPPTHPPLDREHLPGDHSRPVAQRRTVRSTGDAARWGTVPRREGESGVQSSLLRVDGQPDMVDGKQIGKQIGKHSVSRASQDQF